MDYIVAQYLIRTEGAHSDIAAQGVKGFIPFTVEYDAARTPDMLLRTDVNISPADFSEIRELQTFDFEAEYATCHLCRYDKGYLFWMQKGDYINTYVKEDGSNLVITNCGCDERVEVSLLRFGLWIMFGLCTVQLGAIAIHSSVLIKDEGAVLCLGESGTGKSTHTRLWRENIEGTQLLNDDSPIIRLIDGVPTAFGSPWSGKTPCYRNLHYPIRGFIRLSQAPYNKIHRLGVLNAIGALLPSCPPAFAYDDKLQDAICDTLSEMIAAVPVFHLECLPNAEAAQLSYNTIYKK